MTDGSRVLCYKLEVVFTVIISNKPRIVILIICVHQRWLLWQQAVVKIANISLFFTYLKQFLNSPSVKLFQTWHSNRNCVKE